MWDWFDVFLPNIPGYRDLRLRIGLILLALFVLFWGTVLAINYFLYLRPGPNNGLGAKAHWSGGVVIADVSYPGINLPAKDPIEVVWATLDGVSGDQPVPMSDGSLEIPFSKYTGVGNTKSSMQVRYRMGKPPIDMNSYLEVQVPAKDGAAGS